MKKSQLIPIALVFLTIMSVYYLFDSRVTLANDYASALAAARENADNGVMIKAVEEYKEAIDLNPSVDLYTEIAEKYLLNDDYYSAKRWYEREVQPKYPAEPKTYEFGIRMYIDQGDYTQAYELYNTYLARRLSSSEVDQLMDSIKYKYKLVGAFLDVKPFTSTGFAPVVVEDGKWNYVDSSGFEAISETFSSAESFCGDYAAVIKDGKAYYINTDAEAVLTPEYFIKANENISKITQFKDIQSGLVLANDGTSWKNKNKKSYKYLFGDYQDATPVTAGIGAVTKDGVDWALINSKGEEVTGYDFNSVVTDERGYVCRNDTLIAEKNGFFVLIDQKGKEVTSEKYTAAYGFNDNTYAAVEKDGKWIFIDTSGNEHDLGDFQEAKSFSNGLAAVKKDNLWGYIDMNGNVVIDCIFEDARIISKAGYGFVMDDNHKWKVLKLYSAGE